MCIISKFAVPVQWLVGQPAPYTKSYGGGTPVRRELSVQLLVYGFRSCSRTACITPVYLCFMVSGIVGPKVTPITLMLSWKSIPNSVPGTVQLPRTMALDLEGLSCTLEVFQSTVLPDVWFRTPLDV